MDLEKISDELIKIKETGTRLKKAYDIGNYKSYVTNALTYANYHGSYAYFDVLCEEFCNKHPEQFDKSGNYKL